MFGQLKSQKSAKELKLKHVAKGSFLDMLKSSGYLLQKLGEDHRRSHLATGKSRGLLNKTPVMPSLQLSYVTLWRNILTTLMKQKAFLLLLSPTRDLKS